MAAVSASTAFAMEDPPKPPGALADGAAAAGDGVAEYISFSIGNDQYGVSITSVREIKGSAGLTYLPKQPDYVRGVLNLRGVMVPIIDLRCRFGEGPTELSPMHVIIIVQIGEKVVGLLADRVLDIVSFEDTKIQPVPNVANGNDANFLAGLITIDDAMIALIDLDHLLLAGGLGSAASSHQKLAA